MKRDTGFRLIDTFLIIISTILFSGIIIIAFGLHHKNKLLLYTGFGITLIGVLNGIIRIIIYPRK